MSLAAPPRPVSLLTALCKGMSESSAAGGESFPVPSRSVALLRSFRERVRGGVRDERERGLIVQPALLLARRGLAASGNPYILTYM